jgi:D-alanine--poly(phosphoribitol) ligase subunit 2
MTPSDAVIRAIYQAIGRLNDDLPATHRIVKAPETELFGGKGELDSLGLVTLIISVEEAVSREMGRSISIASEKAMSQRNSPFRTVQALADFVNQLLENGTSDD